MASRKVIEVAASGIDDALQGYTSSPYSSGIGLGPGLRVPAILPSGPQPRYLFCLATVTGRGTIRGIRQGLTLGIDTNHGVSPARPIEMFVKTPTWHFPDGNVSWHLVSEDYLPLVPSTTDTTTWSKTQSTGPAMLYKSFTNSATTPSGAPVLYMQGLTAYTPPDLTGTWKDLGGLGNMKDMRFPYDSQHAWSGLNIPFDGRVSLYASVLQTNPADQPIGGSYPTSIDQSGSTPEESFLAAYYQTGEGGTFGINYWRVLGSIIAEFEDM